MNKTIILLLFYILSYTDGYSQIDSQDIKSYKFDIKLSDDTDNIVVKSIISGVTLNNEVVINLSKEMHIDRISIDSSTTLNYKRVLDSVYVNVPSDTFKFSIQYNGIPKDGLIIGKNKFGDRTFFGDNWPNRAKNWLSVYDHPSEKARVEYYVEAPKKYTVVANGKFINREEKDSTDVYHYKTSYEIPSKIMVIGVADFTAQTLQRSPFVITSYVYPQNKMEALYDYSIAPQIIAFFEKTIGRYPFDKLYNVQSTTKYGGMENAGCIFYDENNIDGNRSNEDLLAHEIAHQWFGNSVSEKDWQHLWLSEGFATYLENLYMEKKYGKIKMMSIMEDSRLSVLGYKSQFPYKNLVPSELEDPNSMLNPYSYQKGAWLLHMLRSEIGDKLFIKTLKQFYFKFKYSNADTDDFILVAETVSDKDLKMFFEPWLYSHQLPKYDGKWEYNEGKVIGTITQTQDVLFVNTMELLIKFEDGTNKLKKVNIDSKVMPFEFSVHSKPTELLFDPNNLILKDQFEQ
ncbi:MAG: M1 family metallopeptidase [Flavobacteriales bacterium]|nr:M1 family metallopeptidase [Flavobacteriales bacterium]